MSSWRIRRLLVFGVALALASVAGSAGAAPKGSRKKGKNTRPDHVVLVILGGGIRGRDLADDARMPTLAQMAKEGVHVRRIGAGVPDANAGVTRLLTGAPETASGGETQVPTRPTLMEYVRAGRRLAREQVWYVSFEGGPGLRLAHSSHADFGASVGPAIAHGTGAFAEPLRGFLDVMGRPLPIEAESWTLLRGLRVLGHNVAMARLPEGIKTGLPFFERTERALLRELDRRATLVRGANPNDQRALRAARTVLEVHRPVLTVVRLGDAEAGDVDAKRYEAVVRANDKAIGALRSAIAADEVLAGRTLLVIVAERGRVEKPDAQGRLPADPANRQARFVSLVAEGPGLSRRQPKPPLETTDLCPTLCALLDVPAPEATGQPWTALLPR